MATASRKAKSPPEPAAIRASAEQPGPSHWFFRGLDGVYHFLASLKLAVICILTLALVLAGATFFESAYGVAAVREYFYQSRGFAILLAFLATNIFCAASIRYPWKKRQTGFVVTHIGLLVVLAGAFVSLNYADEGQMGIAEGARTSEVERDHSVVRVQKVEPDKEAKDGVKVLDSYIIPFRPGAFAWNSEEVAALAKTPGYQFQVVASRVGLVFSIIALIGLIFGWSSGGPEWRRPLVLVPATLGLLTLAVATSILTIRSPASPRTDLLSGPKDPFKLVITDFTPSSGEKVARAEPDRDGDPMVRLELLTQPPNSADAHDALEGDNWFVARRQNLYRDSKSQGPAEVVFQEVHGPRAPDLVEDFLHPPAKPLQDRQARFFYKDAAGKPQSYAWTIDRSLVGKTLTLPGSNLVVRFEGFEPPDRGDNAGKVLRDAIAEGRINAAFFTVKRGDGRPIDHFALASMPAFQNSAIDGTPDEMVRISYYYPPKLAAPGAAMTGKFGEIQVLGTDGGKYFYRAFGRDGLKGSGPLPMATPVKVFGGGAMPMQVSIKLAEALPEGGRLRQVYIPVELPRERRDEALPAVQGTMTVDGLTRKISLLRWVPNTQTRWENVRFPGGFYRVAFDFERHELPFSLALKKFTPGKDPGSASPATFLSDVELTDPAQGLKDEPEVITMNEPLSHDGWTFYQSRYNKVDDPETGQSEALYKSYFQVHYDPAWKITYSGCLLVVIGTFLQFYMRAGVFTDGGKRERERAQARVQLAAGASRVATPDRTKITADDLDDL